MSILNRPVMEFTRPAAIALWVAAFLFGLLLTLAGIPSPAGWVFNMAGVLLVLWCLYVLGKTLQQRVTSKR